MISQFFGRTPIKAMCFRHFSVAVVKKKAQTDVNEITYSFDIHNRRGIWRRGWGLGRLESPKYFVWAKMEPEIRS